jgi:hypothetical protein
MKLSQLKQIIKEEINEIGYIKKPNEPTPYQLGIDDTLKVLKDLGILDVEDNVLALIKRKVLDPTDEFPIPNDSTPPIVNETKGKNKYFIIVNFKGQSDELGNFHGIESSDKNDFTQKFKNIFKDDINDYYTFYEVPNKQMMDKIVKLSDQWEGGEDTRETKMLQSIADKAKEFNRLNL